MKYFLIVFLYMRLLYAFPTMPMTYGSYCTKFDSDFDEFRYKERIAHCRRSVSSNVKKQIYARYNIPYNDRGNYTVDHIIPLSLGGDNSKSNLWPQHKSISTVRLEYKMYLQIRDNEITRQSALRIIFKAKNIK